MGPRSLVRMLALLCLAVPLGADPDPAAATTPESEPVSAPAEVVPERVAVVTRGDVRVVAASAFEAHAVGALAEDWATVREDWSPWRRPAGPPEAELHAVPAGRWTGAGAAVVWGRGTGRTSLVSVRWDADLTRRALRRALVEVTLATVWAEEDVHAQAMPWWSSFVAYSLEVRQNIAWRDAAVRWAEARQRAGDWPSLDAVLAGNADDEAAYWLGQALRATAGTPRQWRERLASLAGVRDPWTGWAVLAGRSRAPMEAGREDARAWWREAGPRVAGEMDGAYLTPAASRALVERTSRLAVAVAEGQEGEEIPAEGWFIAAARPEVRAALQAREQEIRADLQRVHPLWHNALLSLGRLAEAARAGEAGLAFAAWQSWQTDTVQAEEETRRIEALLAR